MEPDARRDADASLRVMVAVGGHAFDRPAFEAMLAALPGIACDVVKHPEAARRMTPAGLHGIDALLLYDLPGLDFRDGLDPPRVLPPPDEIVAGFEGLLREGKGIVALHHALAGWPGWPGYGETLGGRFLYRPATVRGVDCPDSGYAPDVEYGVRVVDPAHPVCAGLPARFRLRDELYLCEVFERDVTPLLRADAAFTPKRFLSAAQALRGTPAPVARTTHAPGSNLVGWTRRQGASRVVCLQPGDGAATFADANYRRLLANALRWVARPRD
jgi:hypothetical protein